MSTKSAICAGATDDIRAYLATHPCPFSLWVGPSLWASHGAQLRQTFSDATLRSVPTSTANEPSPAGPAVIALTADDLSGSHREALLQLAARAQPGRPVIYGGSRNKDTLLDAINVWQTYRLVSKDLPFASLAEAIRQAYEALALEHALNLCVAELRRECDQLHDAVAELKLTQDRLLHGERLTAIGHMTGMLMERVQKHFGSMQRFADALRPLADRPTIGRVLQHAVDGTKSVDVLLRDLIALAENRHAELCLDAEQLDALVERAVALFRLDPVARDHEFRVLCRSGATVKIDRYRTYHVLMNLLRNAVQATDPADPISIRTSTEDQSALIEIEDHGPGIPPDVLERIFAPFFSTKGKGGMGLGLRMSKSTVERQGGGLECVSTPGDGACFRIRFPIVKQARERSSTPTASAAPHAAER